MDSFIAVYLFLLFIFVVCDGLGPTEWWSKSRRARRIARDTEAHRLRELRRESVAFAAQAHALSPDHSADAPPPPDGGRHRIITLVHGTFGRESEWLSSVSMFRSRLASYLGRDVQFHAFLWSGSNSHAARVRASEELRAHLQAIATANPGHPQTVIAHSHGGNVACRALADRAIAVDVCLITLGTPFITCRARTLPESLAGLRILVTDVLLIVSTICVCLASIAFANRLVDADVIDESIGFPALVFVVPLLWIVFAGRRLHRWTLIRYNRALQRHQSVETRFKLASISHVHVLSVAIARDEAGLWLQFLHRLGNIPAILFQKIDTLLKAALDILDVESPGGGRWPSYVFLGFGMVVFLLFLVVGIVRFDDYTLARFVVLYPMMLVIVVLIGIVPPAGIVLQLLMVFVPAFVRAHRLGFGGEALSDNWFADIRAVSDPRQALPIDDGDCRLIELTADELEADGLLRHARLYRSDIVVRIAALWIRQVETTHRQRLRALLDNGATQIRSWESAPGESSTSRANVSGLDCLEWMR